MAASLAAFLALCGILGLLGGHGLEEGYTLKRCYTEGTEGLNGGWFGGLMYMQLVSWLGLLGAYVVLGLLLFIGLILTMEASFVDPLTHFVQRQNQRRQGRRERHREEEELRWKEEEIRLEEESIQRRERMQQLEQRRTELRAQSLMFGEATKLDSEEKHSQEETVDSGSRKKTVSKKTAGVKKNNNEEKKKITAEDMEKASVFSGQIHGADQRKAYMPEKEKRTLRELEALDREQELPVPDSSDLPDGWEDVLEQLDTLGKEQLTMPENKDSDPAEGENEGAANEKETDEAEVIMPIFREDEEADRLDTSGWLTSDEVIHPASADFSSEESMAAYDDFHDAPDPLQVLRESKQPISMGNQGGKTDTVPMPSHSGGIKTSSSNGNPSSSGDSFWRQGKSSDGNSGVNLTPIAPVQKEKPVVRRDYRFPPMSMLKQEVKKGGSTKEQLKQTAVKLQQTLQNFGVGVKVTDISCGPAVTRYELQPDQGVKVSRIVSLSDDIKLNLAAADIRIEAPIPGKAAVGIEVPNKVSQTVFLRELLDSDEFRRSPSKVSFGVGKDISGKVIVADLARMPHLLIAGATGSGKSVCINTIIMSILYKAHPDDVKLIMIDPKVVELSVYNGIPHLMIPVVTDPKKAAGALNWAVAEMSERYKQFAEMGVRDIKSYNTHVEKSGDSNLIKMPQIVVIVDELADLMMVAAGEVEEAICRLAQLARAAGIHLVLATQRPSVNIITGLIKANVPSRIAFAVSSGVDSRTIIDMNGAEKLLGQGDMLFYPAGYSKPVRVQGAFVSDEEVSQVVEFLAEQNDGDNRMGISLEKHLENMKDQGTVGSGDHDELFVKAGRFIIEKDKASIGNLQRAFRIGFNRAARIMDQLADYGVVGPDEGTKARQILMSREQFEELVSGME
ncbi:MAG: DNA translocase FtsK [Clostridiales bacterium]|nr:DNA translocase FtsK [Clostridiales bacterium]